MRYINPRFTYLLVNIRNIFYTLELFWSPPQQNLVWKNLTRHYIRHFLNGAVLIVYLVLWQATSIYCVVATCGKIYWSTSNAKAALQMPTSFWHQEIVSSISYGDSSSRMSVTHSISHSRCVTRPMNSSFASHDNRLSSPWRLTTISVVAAAKESNILARDTVRDKTAQNPNRMLNSEHTSKNSEIYPFSCWYICLI